MDNGNFGSGQQPTAWVRAYRADGWQVNFTLVLDPADLAGSANTQIAALAAGGFTPNAPGVPDGGNVEMIGWVSRRIQINSDERPDTPIIDLFLDNEGWNGRMVGIYLNTPEEVAAFEHACGIKMTALPLYDSAIPAKRDDPRSSKYVVRLPRPTAAFIGENPRWEGAEDKKNQKRKFFGWKDAPVAPAQPANVVDAISPANEFDVLDAAGLPSANDGAPVPEAFKKIVEPHWTQEKQFTDAIFDKAQKAFGMSKPSVLAALDVKVITQYTGTKEEAFSAIKSYAEKRKAS